MTTIRSTLPVAVLAMLAGASPLAAAPEADGALHVQVTGLHSRQGQLIACLWREASKFPSCEKSRTALRRTVPVTGTSMEVTLPLPAPGRYAVTIVHDEDGNGRTKHNFIGMPREGVGISNNPGGMPGYKKSLVDARPGGTIAIRMKYLFD